MRCAACRSEIADAHRFCAFCGAPVATPSQMPTAAAAGVAVLASPVTPAAARVASRDPSGADFTPGTLIADRYRVVALLGRGGMGEVYRADDLKLGHPVALKFLPGALAVDAARLDRLLAEVRMARQVSHPNICRVHDIGELAGEPFLSMEYVDGEDLASLLQRIGRLPADKALDIARQICAGLAASHDRGVLHRDLKPANVMLDGRGRVRITDFGLAVAADRAGRGDISGTPAYMAPEQLAGQPASIRSDIYALGLVLYELYTGRRAFDTGPLTDVLAYKERGVPRAPSEFITEMDPAIERVILRAIAPDPRARPSSVAQVAAALPGGNALDAVLRAGDTPSPDLVAASGTREGLEPAAAWALLALVAAGSVAAAVLASDGLLWRRAAPDKSPDVLVEIARQTLAALGYPDRPIDRASGFEVDPDYLRYLRWHDPVHWRSTRHEPSFLRFWYRESPQPLEAWRFPLQYGNVSRVSPADPPLEVVGMTLVRLDPGGRVTQLVVVPPSAAAAGGETAAGAPDWAALLRRAGYDPSAWRTTAPGRNPPVFADARAAWEGTWPDARSLAVRLEAAALGGRPVYLEVVYPWTPPPRSPSAVLTDAERAGLAPAFVILAATVIGMAVLARRNVRAGRGDRRGAARLAAFVGGAMVVSWFFGESHVATLWEVVLVVMALAWALLAAALCWLAYLAAEPFLRRRWPEVLVTWNRVLAGEFRDPLVGRDVLVGCAAGPMVTSAAFAGYIVPERLGIAADISFADFYGIAYGVQSVVPLLVWRSAQAVVASLACVFLLLLLRLAIRSPWGAAVAFVVAGAAVAGAGTAHFWVGFTNTAIMVGLFVALLVRFGLVAAVVQFYVFGLFVFFPVTTDFGAWYAGAGVTALLVLAALALYGFGTALAGRPPLGRATGEA